MKKWILILFSVICAFTLILFCIFNFLIYPKKYKNFVIEYSSEFNLDTSLVYAIIKAESNFNPNAVSPSGAKGLMQLINSTASWIASELGETYVENNLFDGETNIRYGCFYLNYLYKKFNNVDIVICAYNAGENAVRNWLDENGNLVIDKISYLETKNYYKKVKGYIRIYSSNEISI